MADSPQKKTDPSAKRDWSWKRWIVPPFAALLLLCGSVYLLTATGPGLRLVLGIVEGPISASLEGKFSAEGISGSLWSELRIDRLALALPDGLSVEGKNLLVAWQPTALLGGRLQVQAVGAEHLAVILPDAGPSESPGEEERAAAFSIPRLPVRVAVRKLDFPVVSVTIPDGTAYRASILGGVSTTQRDEIQTTVDIAAELDGRPVDRIALDALVSPGDEPRMTLSLTAEVPSDGVLFAVLDAPAEFRRPVSAAISGSGNLTAWAGDLQVTAQGLAGLSGKLGLGITDAGPQASFDGTAALVDPETLGLPADLAGDYSIVIPDLSVLDDVISVQGLQVKKDGLAEIILSARMALDQSDLSANGIVTLASDAARLAQIPVAFAGAQVTFQATGALPDLEGSAKFSAQDVAGYGNTAQALDGTVSAKGALDSGVSVEAEITATGLAWGEDALRQLLGRTVRISAEADLDPSFQAANNIVVTVDPLGASLHTSLRFDGLELIADTVRAELQNLALLEPVLGLPIAGSGSVLLSGLSVSEEGTVSSVFEVGAKGFSILDDQVSGLLGQTPLAKGDILFSETDGLAVTLHDARARAGAASGVFLVSADFAELSGEMTLRAVASALAPDAVAVIDGDNIDVTARFAGPIESPDADLVVAPFGGALSGTPFQVQALEAQLRWREENPFLTFQGKGAAMGLAASVEGGAVVEADGLNVPGVAVTGEGWSAWAAANLPGFALPAEGSARIVVSDASPFAALAGLYGLSGQAILDAQFGAGNGEGAQSVEATMSADRIAIATDASAPPINIERVDGSADIGDVLTLRDIDSAVAIRNVAGPGFNLTEIGAVLRGTGDAVEGDLTVTGVDPTPLTLTSHLAGRVLGDGAGELHMTELKLGYATLEQLATGRADASFGPGDALSAAVDLSVLSGTVTAAYGRAGGTARLSLDALDIPIGPLAEMQGQSGVEGTLNAKADLREANGPVAGAFSVSATGLRSDDLDKDVSIDVTVGGDVAGDRVRFEARTAGTGLDKVDIRGGVPLAVSLIQPGAVLNQEGTLEGLVKADIQLREIWPYLPLPEHTATGLLTVDVRLGGTPANPAIQGETALRDGEYEHLVQGTLIKNIQGRVRFSGEDVVLESLTGEDPYGGGFGISGKGGLAGGRPVFDIATKLKALRVVNSDAVKADVDADIKVGQQDDGMLVQGQVLVRRAEVNLSVALPPSIATLDVEDGSVDGPGPSQAAEPSRIALDLTIDAPGQIFVRGRGLDSEWQGNVKVTGTAKQPIVSGGLAARRGRIDVIGKGFTLDQSTIKFFGGETMDPMLGIRGVHEGDDITVIALLEGPSSKPEIKLESQPPLPEDEVLSRLLFGKTASSLSPLEAAQLAASASELAGGGSGLDVLGTIRDFVGVDVLEVDTSGDAAAVKAGSYVAEGVFVGAKQGAAPGSSSVTVEVEVTPNISVTTESGQTSSNAGVNFKWDY